MMLVLQKHIEDRLERIHQLEEEAQRLAQAMAPLINASNCNGLPPRKLHTDNDKVTSLSDISTVSSCSSSSSNGDTGQSELSIKNE